MMYPNYLEQFQIWMNEFACFLYVDDFLVYFSKLFLISSLIFPKASWICQAEVFHALQILEIYCKTQLHTTNISLIFSYSITISLTLKNRTHGVSVTSFQFAIYRIKLTISITKLLLASVVSFSLIQHVFYTRPCWILLWIIINK